MKGRGQINRSKTCITVIYHLNLDNKSSICLYLSFHNLSRDFIGNHINHNAMQSLYVLLFVMPVPKISCCVWDCIKHWDFNFAALTQ